MNILKIIDVHYISMPFTWIKFLCRPNPQRHIFSIIKRYKKRLQISQWSQYPALEKLMYIYPFGISYQFFAAGFKNCHILYIRKEIKNLGIIVDKFNQYAFAITEKVSSKYFRVINLITWDNKPVFVSNTPIADVKKLNCCPKWLFSSAKVISSAKP